jgi:hypothetical protein
MNLEQLKEALDNNFGAPFLKEGQVQTRWIENLDYPRVLEIKIGRRDIWLDGNGRVVASGTDIPGTGEAPVKQVPAMEG